MSHARDANELLEVASNELPFPKIGLARDQGISKVDSYKPTFED